MVGPPQIVKAPSSVAVGAAEDDDIDAHAPTHGARTVLPRSVSECPTHGVPLSFRTVERCIRLKFGHGRLERLLASGIQSHHLKTSALRVENVLLADRP